MRAHTVAAAALFALTGGCAARPPRASIGDTAPVIPVLELDEAKDEWLHDRCAYKGMVGASAMRVQIEARNRAANLGELVYIDGDVSHVALFRCAAAPQWYAGNWQGDEPVPPGATGAPTSFRVAGAPAIVAPPPKAPPKPAVGYVLVGSGVAALLAGGVTGYMTLQAKSDVAAHCDANRTCDATGLDANARGRGLSIASTVLVATGAVATGIGLYVLVSPGKTATAQVGARVVGDGGVLELTGRF